MEKVAVNGIDIAYTLAGEGDPLLLIHGSFVSHVTWQTQLESLAGACRMIAVDVRGHGESGRSREPYSIAQFASDMAALLDALAIEQAVICGHSMGGMIAQQMAVNHPERVRAAILAETNYGTGDDAKMKMALKASTAMFKLFGIERALSMGMKQLAGKHPENAPMLAAEMKPHAAAPDNFWNIVNAMNAWDGKAQLAQINCPALVMVGADNQMTQRQGRYMADTIPSARFVSIPDAGHGMNLDNPEAFDQAVLAFIQGLPA